LASRFSATGKLFWGFNGDWDALPDFHNLVAAVEASFAELQKAARRNVDADSQKRALSHARHTTIARQFGSKIGVARPHGVKKSPLTVGVIAGRASVRKSAKMRRSAKAGR
jgi:hypothetical protein